MWYACYMYYLFGMPLSRKAVFGLGAKPTNDKDHCALLIGALYSILPLKSVLQKNFSK